MEEKRTGMGENSETCVGSVKIADDVVGVIAALAATEIEGVNSMAGSATSELLGRVGVKAASRGIKVAVNGKSVKVEASIVIEYGYNIPATCQKVQDKIKNTIENMTGLTVADVDVKISGISVPGK